MQHVSLSVQGMSCQHCVRAVRDALEAIPGASVVEVSVGSATVEIDPSQVEVGALIDAIDDAGYAATTG